MIGVAVVGFGYWGPNLVRNFSEVDGVRIMAVCDPRPDRRDVARRRLPAVRVEAEFSDVLADSSVDAVVIATPVSSHSPLVLEALRAGKHVFVEKPLATNVPDAEHLVEEAARCGRVLMVDHTFVYTGAVRKIKEILSADTLGELYYYDSVRVNLGRFQSDVNVVWDLAVHDCAIMDYLLPKRPCRVMASGVRHIPDQPESMAYLTWVFEGNLLAHLHVNWLAPVKVRQTLLGGSQRMIVYDDIEPTEKVKVYDKGVEVNGSPELMHDRQVGYRSGDMFAPKLSHTEALRIAAEHFVRCIEQGERPLTDGMAGWRVVKMLDAATRSMNRGGLPVELNW